MTERNTVELTSRSGWGHSSFFPAVCFLAINSIPVTIFVSRSFSGTYGLSVSGCAHHTSILLFLFKSGFVPIDLLFSRLPSAKKITVSRIPITSSYRRGLGHAYHNPVPFWPLIDTRSALESHHHPLDVRERSKVCPRTFRQSISCHPRTPSAGRAADSHPSRSCTSFQGELRETKTGFSGISFLTVQTLFCQTAGKDFLIVAV